jgi:hypothetical protein
MFNNFVRPRSPKPVHVIICFEKSGVIPDDDYVEILEPLNCDTQMNVVYLTDWLPYSWF